jgi:hypothetical protein
VKQCGGAGWAPQIASDDGIVPALSGCVLRRRRPLPSREQVRPGSHRRVCDGATMRAVGPEPLASAARRAVDCDDSVLRDIARFARPHTSGWFDRSDLTE